VDFPKGVVPNLFGPYALVVVEGMGRAGARVEADSILIKHENEFFADRPPEGDRLLKEDATKRGDVASPTRREEVHLPPASPTADMRGALLDEGFGDERLHVLVHVVNADPDGLGDRFLRHLGRGLVALGESVVVEQVEENLLLHRETSNRHGRWAPPNSDRVPR